MLKNRNKKNIICIDKSLLPYLNHISNFVPVIPFKPFENKNKFKKKNENENSSIKNKNLISEKEVHYYNYQISLHNQSNPRHVDGSENDKIEEDTELKKLLHYLKQILGFEDSKTMNQKTLQMQQFLLN